MRANEFVKKYGWDEAIKQIKNPTGTHGASFDYSFMGDLKRLVESHELVDSLGGLDKAKKRCYPTKHLTMDSFYKLKQAIADMESCL